MIPIPIRKILLLKNDSFSRDTGGGGGTTTCFTDGIKVGGMPTGGTTLPTEGETVFGTPGKITPSVINNSAIVYYTA